LNTANRHQDFVVCIEMGFAQGAGSSRDQRQSIATATLPSIGQTWQQWANMPLCLPAGGCFAPSHGQAVTLHKAQYWSPVPTSITRRLHAYGIGWTESLSKDRINCLPAVKPSPCL